METSLKKMESEAEHVEKKAANLGKSAVQDKMKVVGTIGSILSVCMYVSYIRQSVRSPRRLDPAVRRIHQLHDLGDVRLLQAAARLADHHRQRPGNRLRSDHCIDCTLLRFSAEGGSRLFVKEK